MKKIITFIVIIFTCAVSQAQLKGDQLAYFNWNFGPTIGNHFVSNFSGKGANAGYSWFIKDNLAIGGEVGWNNYYEYAARQTYITKDGAITTDMYKYLYTVPVTATITKYFKAGKYFYPYTKLGLGVLYSEQNLYYNIYEAASTSWGFVAVPEIGANIKLDPANNWAFNVGAQYKYGTNSAKQYNINNTQTYNFNAGVVWRVR